VEGIGETIPEGLAAAVVAAEAVPGPVVGDVAVTLPPADEEAEGWTEAPGLLEDCPPLDDVPPGKAAEEVPEAADVPPAATMPPPAGAEDVPEGRTAALGPTLTATSSSLVVPRRRSCRWKRRTKSP